MLAPPWVPMPPPGYGGIELVLSLLCEGLVRRGHEVVLFASPGSRLSGDLHEVLSTSHEGDMHPSLHEVDLVSRVFAALDDGAAGGHPYDVLHDHCGFTAVAMADRISVPVVHTLHGPFTPETIPFYLRHGGKAHLVATSGTQRAAAPEGVRISAVVPDPIDVDDWPFEPRKHDYLLWLGRMTPVEGPHRAIAVARAAGVRLVLAGPVQAGDEVFFRDHVEPHVDGEDISYAGELGGEGRARLMAGARALLMPTRGEEPSGLVMIEALACGTPVISFPQGAAPEIVQDGVNGYLAVDEDAMAAAVRALPGIDPADCLGSVARRYAVDSVVAGYESVYGRVALRSART